VHNGVADLGALAEGLDLTAAGDNAFVRAVRRARRESEARYAKTARIAKFDNRA
jgi:hypothetical protein